MKKTFLTTMLLLTSVFLCAGLKTPVNLFAPAEPIEEGDDHGMHKAPPRCPIHVDYDEENTSLVLSSFETLGNITYSIKDEDEIVVLSGTIYIQEDQEENVSVSSLSAGDYIFEVEINDITYTGTFTVEP